MSCHSAREWAKRYLGRRDLPAAAKDLKPGVLFNVFQEPDLVLPAWCGHFSGIFGKVAQL